MPETPAVSFDKRAFKDALQQVVRSAEFRKRLEERPTETLESLGIGLPQNALRLMKDRRLSEIAAGIDLGAGTQAHVAVSVGVEVAVSVVVRVAVETKVTPGLEEVRINEMARQAQRKITSVNRALRV